MTTERAAIAARHFYRPASLGDRPHDWCDDDGDPWPCDTIRALALPPPVERLREAIDSLDDVAESDRIWRAMSSNRLAAAIVAAWETTAETGGEG